MTTTTRQKLVFPGTCIGTEEEYLQGAGTYSRDGVLYASVPGHVSHMDANINNPKMPRLIKVGQPVLARVDESSDPIMLLTVKPLSNEHVVYPKPSIVHVSESDSRYVESIRDVARSGDIIFGEVSKVNRLGTNISLRKPEFGVVLAACSRCRKPLKLDNTGQHPRLKCPACGSVEYRKFSPYYGNLPGLLQKYKVEL